MSDEVTTGELNRRLDRMEAKLDRVLEDQEGRLRSVERFISGWRTLAATGAGSGILAFLGVGPWT